MTYPTTAKAGKWHTTISIEVLGFNSLSSRDKPIRFLTTANGKNTISICTLRP
jgi:hypothetical protein